MPYSGVVCCLALLILGPSHAEDAPSISPEDALRQERQEQAAARLATMADSIGASVAELRELPFKAPLNKGTKSLDGLREYLQNHFDAKMPKTRLEAISRAYASIGLLPPKTDLRRLLMDLLLQQIAGFYDPDTKAFYLVDQWNFSEAAIVSHELTHALQDQHFDLKSLPIEDETREDMANAAKAVIEGEAMLVMMRYLAHHQGNDAGLIDKLMGRGFRNFLQELDRGNVRMEDAMADIGQSFGGIGGLGKVPRVIREGLVFGYLHGLSLVHRAYRQGGWQAVNALYTDLPQSTEQVMHLNRYFGERDRPTRITVERPQDIAPPGYQLIYQSVLGELYVSVLFQEFLHDKAQPAAWEGWDGDLFLAFQEGDQENTVYVWLTLWDSDQDAREFADGYRRVLEKRGRTGTAGKETGLGDDVGAPPPGVPCDLLEQRGPEVLLIGGPLACRVLRKTAESVWRVRKLEETPILRAAGAGQPK